MNNLATALGWLCTAMLFLMFVLTAMLEPYERLSPVLIRGKTYNK